MSNEVKMTLGVALVLDELIRVLLTKTVKDEDGSIREVERELPFRLKYRLTRNKTTLDKDMIAFNKQRLICLAKHGEPNEDNTNIVIKDPVKQKQFEDEVSALLATEVKHTVMKLDPADFDEIEEFVPVSEDLIKVLLGYLVEDKEFLDDINTQINFKGFTEEPEESTEEATETTEETT